MTHHFYRACGLTLRLPLPCPALLPAAPAKAADITVTFGPTPAALPNPIAGERQWQLTARRFLYRMGRFGRYLVEDGACITVTPQPGTEEADICFHLLYVCLAMALQQRGLLVLHGNSVVVDGRAVIFAGESGAGKSTLLAALLATGHAMLADDVTVIDAPATRPPTVRPGFPHYKLCRDAAARFGVGDTPATPVRWRPRKLGIQAAPAAFVDAPTPLAAVFLLAQHESAPVTCTRLRGVAKFAGLREHIYGPDEIGEQQPKAHTAMQVAATIPVYRLSRPRRGWTLPEVIQQVRQQLAVVMA